MSISIKARVIENKLPGIQQRFAKEADAIARKTAHDVQAGAAVRTSRVDTGAMKGGYVVEMIAPGVYKVYNTQGYQIFHELGTRFIAAEPMLIPAAAEAEAAFHAAFQRLAALA